MNNNDETTQLNGLLRDMCDENDFLYLVNHDNLRDNIEYNMYDDKLGKY